MSLRDVHISIGDVDLTPHIRDVNIDVLHELQLEDGWIDVDFVGDYAAGPVQGTLDPDEWAVLTEHVAISDEPGEF